MTLKQQRARAIANTIAMACNYIGVDLSAVMAGTHKKHHPEHNARRIIWYHLHACGMHKREIGRIFNRAEGGIHDGIRYAYLNLTERYEELLRMMPAIPAKLKPCSTSTPS